MTRKEFVRAAEIARLHTLPHRISIAGAFAQLFESATRFDRARFFIACGLDESGEGPPAPKPLPANTRRRNVRASADA